MDFVAGINPVFEAWGSAGAPALPPGAGGDAQEPDAADAFAVLVDMLSSSAVIDSEARTSSSSSTQSVPVMDESEVDATNREKEASQEDVCQVSWQTFALTTLPALDVGDVATPPAVAAEASAAVPVQTVSPAGAARMPHLPAFSTQDRVEADGKAAGIVAGESGSDLALQAPIAVEKPASGDSEQIPSEIAVPPGAARSFARALAAVTPDRAPVETPPAAPDVRVDAAALDRVSRDVVLQPLIAQKPEAEMSAGDDAGVKLPTDPAAVPQRAGAALASTDAHAGDSGLGSNREGAEPQAFRELAFRRMGTQTETTEAQAAEAAPAAPHAFVVDKAIASPVLSRAIEVPQAAPVPEDQDTAQQIVRAIRTQFRDGIGEARIRLKPDHLGEVSIALKVDGDRVTATLHVERAEVRQAIEAQSNSLRAGLAAQGLRLEELSVTGDAPSRHERRSEDMGQRGRGDEQEPQQQKRRHQEEEGEFASSFQLPASS